MLATLLSYANIVLLIKNRGTCIKKFVAFDRNKEVLRGLEIFKGNGDISAKLFEHPLEDGAVISDHRILNPKNISLQAYISIDDELTIKELNYYYAAGKPLKIRLGNNVINNAYIETEPIEVSGSCIDKTLYQISFKEAQEITPVYVGLSNSKRASNASRVNSGQKQGQKVNRSWIASALWGGRTN